MSLDVCVHKYVMRMHIASLRGTSTYLYSIYGRHQTAHSTRHHTCTKCVCVPNIKASIRAYHVIWSYSSQTHALAHAPARIHTHTANEAIIFNKLDLEDWQNKQLCWCCFHLLFEQCFSYFHFFIRRIPTLIFFDEHVDRTIIILILPFRSSVCLFVLLFYIIIMFFFRENFHLAMSTASAREWKCIYISQRTHTHIAHYVS